MNRPAKVVERFERDAIVKVLAATGSGRCRFIGRVNSFDEAEQVYRIGTTIGDGEEHLVPPWLVVKL